MLACLFVGFFGFRCGIGVINDESSSCAQSHKREWRSAEHWTSAGVKRIDRKIFALILFEMTGIQINFRDANICASFMT